MTATRRYDHVPTLDLSTRRYIVTALTPRAVTFGLQLGDVVEIGEQASVVYRNCGFGPARKFLDSLIVTGTLRRIEVTGTEEAQ